MLSKKLAAIAAVSLITASTAATAQSAAARPASPNVQRAAASTNGESDLDRRGIGIYIVGAVVLGLIIWGILKLTNGDEAPISP